MLGLVLSIKRYKETFEKRVWQNISSQNISWETCQANKLIDSTLAHLTFRAQWVFGHVQHFFLSLHTSTLHSPVLRLEIKKMIRTLDSKAKLSSNNTALWLDSS